MQGRLFASIKYNGVGIDFQLSYTLACYFIFLLVSSLAVTLLTSVM